MARFAVYHYGELTRGAEEVVLTFDPVPPLPLLGHVQAPEGASIFLAPGRTPRLLLPGARGGLAVSAADAVREGKAGSLGLSWHPARESTPATAAV
jgi:hypothetical protein